MTEFENIMSYSHDCRAKWEIRVAHPFARAYAKALKNFEKTEQAQNKLQKSRADLGLLVLTICSGGLISHVFAQTAWKAVLKTQVIDKVFFANKDEAFRKAHFISENKVADFIAGEIWSRGGKSINQKIRSSFLETTANYPSTQKWTTETDALTSLEDFVGDCYLKYRDLVRSVFNTSYISESEKQLEIKRLLNTKFANPPSFYTVNESQVAEEMELMMYLKVVLDTDYTQTYDGYVGPNRAGGKRPNFDKGARIAVAEMPGTKNYPTPIHNSQKMGHHTHQSGINVGYNELGKAYFTKINQLHNKLFGAPLLTQRLLDFGDVEMNKEKLTKAYQAVQKLEKKGMGRFMSSLNMGLR